MVVGTKVVVEGDGSLTISKHSSDGPCARPNIGNASDGLQTNDAGVYMRRRQQTTGVESRAVASQDNELNAHSRTNLY